MTPTANAESLLRGVQELHCLFMELTGHQHLTLSYMRISSWHELMKRGYGPDEVRLVIRWIKQQMSKPGSGYSPQSLQFNRLIQDADIFEDRLNVASQVLRPRLKIQTVPHTQRLPDGSTLTRAVEHDPAKNPPEHVRAAVADSLRQLGEQIRKG